MKKIYKIILAFTLFVTTTIFAQAPQKMSYQAVIRNASNTLVTSQSVGMQISILQGSSSGTVVYVETQTPTTNINGLATLEIGTGTIVSGTFASINWANGPYFIKTETDPSGGTSYSIVGSSEFLSVPYALYSLNGTPGSQGATGLIPNGTVAGNTPFWNGTNWVTNSSNIFNNGGNIGIGTTTPLSNLHIYGDVNNGISSIIENRSNANNAFSAMSFRNNTSSGMHLFLNSSTRNTDGGLNTATLRNDAGNLQLQAKGASGIFVEQNSGRVGMGTDAPMAKLEVNNGSTPGAIKIVDGTQGNGKVLVSDASGLATWQDATGLKYLGKLQTDVGSSGTPMINNNMPTTLTWFTPFIDYSSSLSVDGQTITIPAGVSKIRITTRIAFLMFDLNVSTVYHRANVAITLNGNSYGWSSERVSTNQDFLLFNGWNFSSPLLDVVAGDAIQMKVFQNNGVDYGLGWGSTNNTFLVVEYYQ